MLKAEVRLTRANIHPQTCLAENLSGARGRRTFNLLRRAAAKFGLRRQSEAATALSHLRMPAQIPSRLVRPKAPAPLRWWRSAKTRRSPNGRSSGQANRVAPNRSPYQTPHTWHGKKKNRQLHAKLPENRDRMKKFQAGRQQVLRAGRPGIAVRGEANMPHNVLDVLQLPSGRMTIGKTHGDGTGDGLILIRGAGLQRMPGNSHAV